MVKISLKTKYLFIINLNQILMSAPLCFGGVASNIIGALSNPPSPLILELFEKIMGWGRRRGMNLYGPYPKKLWQALRARYVATNPLTKYLLDFNVKFSNSTIFELACKIHVHSIEIKLKIMYYGNFLTFYRF